MIYVYDVEARLLRDAPDTEGKGLPAAIWWELLCIGVLALDNDCMPVHLGLFGESAGQSQRAILESFAFRASSVAGNGTSSALVSFNGRGFDLPVIIAAALAEGVPVPALFERAISDRYRGDGHIDLMDHLTLHGAGKAPTLTGACHRIGWPGKVGVTGADVAILWVEDPDAVRRYCLQDVVQTAALFLRVQLIKGWLSLEAFQKAGEALLAFCEKDARVVELVPMVDRDRFLLRRASQ